MDITYTRVYDRAMVIVSSEGLSDVVSSIYCIVTGTDDNGFSLNIGEDIALDPPQSTNFIPFDEITKETIDGWITVKEQYKTLELQVEQGIGGIVAPAIVVRSFNFEIPAEPEVIEEIAVEEIAEEVTVEEVVEPEVAEPEVIEEEVTEEETNTEIGTANVDITSI